MADEITRWSEELARDPSSRVFLQLGEALRRQGQHELALKIAVRGLERHSHDADAHDLLARIVADRGELERAFDEWDMALRLQPGHVGAMKGLGFVAFQLGRLADAERYLQQAADAGAGDSVRGALDTVRRRTSRPVAAAPGGHDAAAPPRTSNGRAPERDSLTDMLRDAVPDEAPDVLPDAALAPTYLFADLLSDAGQAAMLLDEDGLVMAGAYPTAEGTDVAQEVGAELSGVSDEARRATRHLAIGDWRSILVETEHAVVAMMPTDAVAAREGLVLLAASRATPLGLVRRLLVRCGTRARGWLAREAR